ncbi:hypothetical protein BAUCODRAFT_520000 [Baudoinia panamericana UAMH 10762]|uniref:Uncharacterized protein n=1 Tax=Baudoinia panamericana (strain UAMH 10762) TaxID=717646 RepID=M2MEF6_BAUPA|nr:uncharacterized protein BAUCODRAFT_520000 [Baudoinia panamericana UAMH 10762]EMC94956.1 hypothetical protein BAUCODRAFT_520000 [Baudoinia panamericana UAMH 10762]
MPLVPMQLASRCCPASVPQIYLVHRPCADRPKNHNLHFVLMGRRQRFQLRADLGSVEQWVPRSALATPAFCSHELHDYCMYACGKPRSRPRSLGV